MVPVPARSFSNKRQEQWGGQSDQMVWQESEQEVREPWDTCVMEAFFIVYLREIIAEEKPRLQCSSQ